MMKKVWLILLAVVLVFGFAVLGCGGGDGGGPGTGGDDDAFTSNLTGLTTQLVKNQYAEDAGDSRGLQSKFNPAQLLSGYKIKTGDTLKLQLKFKVDKTLAYPLEIGFVDTTVGADEGYWRTLTWDKDDPDDDMYKIPAAELIADTEIEKEIELTAVKGGSSVAAAANSLVFESRDVWTKDPVTITFVEFLLIVNGGGSEPPPPPPPPPTEPIFSVTVDGAEVDATAFPEGGEVEIIDGGFKYILEAANYQGTYLCFSVDLGDLTLIDIASVSFKAKGLTGGTDDKTGQYGLQLWAKKTKITGGVWSNAPEIQAANGDYTTGEVDVTINISPTKVLALDLGEESELYFVIYWPLSGAASFQITDIEFVKSATPFTPIVIGTIISGIQAPANGGTPTATVTGTGYTGAVTWKDASGNAPAGTGGTFVLGTVYTATIVLTKTSGYTFDGIAANTFVVAGATVTNPAGTPDDTLTVTATFPAATATINDKTLTFAEGDVFGKNADITLEGTTGFSAQTTQGYEWAWAYFKVTFDSGVKLSNYTKLDYTITGNAGNSGELNTDNDGNPAPDGGYKSFFINAYVSKADIDAISTGLPETEQIAGGDWQAAGIQNLDTAYSHTVTIATSLPAGTDDNVVWIAVRTAAKKGYKFKLTDIKFHN